MGSPTPFANPNPPCTMSDLAYDLPETLIAQHPPSRREAARLLVMKRSDESLVDDGIGHLPEYLAAGDLLVLNNTKVLPAKFLLRRETGGKVEGLFLEEERDGNWLVMLKGARRLREGEPLEFQTNDDALGKDAPDAANVFDPSVRVGECVGDGKWRLEVSSSKSVPEILDRFGRAPLPPYIKRVGSQSEAVEDLSRYQTVYAESPGAIAAPTAGLHFTNDMLNRVRSRGVGVAFVTLHVGIGTFKPITADRLSDHKMHLERYEISAETAVAIRACKDSGGRVVAVGTTTCRALESACAESGDITPGANSTDIFIYPPYRFRVVDALLTNFHLPKSTLLAMLFAFAGTPLVQRAYRHAVESQYRFFSYGDAMLVL